MIFAFDDFELEAEQLELRCAGKLLEADALVLRLLLHLVENAGKLLSKEQLVEHVWEGRAVADNAITVSMARLRKLLGQTRGGPEYVSTTYGRGYRFVRQVEVRAGQRAVYAVPREGPAAGPPFVGRERVLTQLRRALQDARAGRGRGCLVLGEAGIGKTRVVEAFTRELGGSEVYVSWGFCREAGDTPPLWPWARLVSDAAASLAGSGRSPQLGAALPDDLRRFFGLVPGAPAVLDVPPSAIGTVASPDRHRYFAAIMRLFARAAEAAPWVLVIDDLHRADAASLELLGQLLDEIAHSRLLVLATLRDRSDRRSARIGTHLPQVLAHRNCDRIRLDRLDEQAVARYVGALFDDADHALGRAVFQKSAGNPFLMTELVHTLADNPQADPHGLALPSAALELVRQRVVRLGPELIEVLSAAAVIGRSFELPLLAALTERDPSRLMLALDEAIEGEVVVAAPGSMTAFAFAHELLRAVLYDALPAHEQRRWHLRLGQLLELRLEQGDAVPASELAYHFHAALPDGEPRKTVQYCRDAAAAAAAVFASPDVVRYARHALEALELMDRPSLRLRMSLQYLLAMYARGHAPRVCERAIGEVSRLAREHGDPVMLLRAATMFNVHPGFEPLPGQGPLLEQALRAFQPEASGFRSVALAALALAAPHCFSASASHALFEEAVPLCRQSGSPLALYAVLLNRLYRYGGPAHVEQTEETVAELEHQALHNPAQTPVLPISLALHRAIGAFQAGDLATLQAATERARVRAHSLHSQQKLWHTERLMALTQLQFGDLSKGVSELERLHERAESGTIWGAELACAFDRAVTFAELGSPRRLDDEWRAALQYRASDPPAIWAAKLRALAGSGRFDEARGALRAVAPEALAELPCDLDYLGTLGHLARASLLLHADDYARALYALLSPYAERFAVNYRFVCEGSGAQLLGLISLAAGELDRAALQLEAAAAQARRAGLLVHALEAGLGLAQCLRQRAGVSDFARAADLARSVQIEAEQLGHARLEAQAAVLVG